MRKQILKNISFVLAIVCAMHAQGQTAKDKIAAAYQTFKDNPKLTNGISSFTVLDGKTGAPIFSDNAAVGLATASTLKVITSITALDILGANYTYKTQLAYAGEIDSLGILHGDIIISGTGDPTLGSERYSSSNAESLLNKWIYKLKNAGIRQVNGRIISDDLYFNGNDVPAGWSWTDIGNYYGAGISGLNWRENKIGIDFTAGAVGQAASVKTPALPKNLHLVNEVTTGSNGSGDNVYAYSAPYSELIYLRGSYGKDLKKTIEIAMPDPALSLAEDLHAAMVQHDILLDSLSYVTTGKRLANEGIRLTAPKTELDMHQSPPLKDIIHWFNQKSINLYGEALLKSFGKLSGNKSDTEEAAKLLVKYWEQKLKIAGGELNIKDGCGLSAQNRVTTTAMAKIMFYAKSRPWFADFEKSLPKINNTSMKSGTIGGVLGYTGYQAAASGSSYTFSLLINNYSGSAAAMRQDMFKLLDNLK